MKDNKDKFAEGNDKKIEKNQKKRRKKHIHLPDELLHIIGYKNTGTGDAWATMIRSAMIIRRRIMGIIQILFDLVRRIVSCLMD